MNRAIAATLVLACTAAACRRSAPVEQQIAAPVGVTAAAARTETLRDIATAPGTIVPAAAGDWTITAPAPAKIVELPKKEGDAVQTGDLLVRFDVPAWTQALAAREQALADASGELDRAKAEAARLEDLFNRGLAARNTWQASLDKVGTAQAAMNQARTELDLARLDDSRSEVRARFAGTVQKIWHAEGDFVSDSATDPVLRVVDATHLQATAQLPPAELARVTPGQIAVIRAIADGVDRPGSVVQKQASLEPTSPTGEVRVGFAEPPPPTLTLDAPVSIEIVLDQRTGALVIPVAAIQRSEAGDGPYVMVIDTEGRAHHREIRTGLVTKELAQVLTGLAAGERVIVTGAGEVAEGTRVVVAQP